MNENNININVENEQGNNPIYSSRFLLNKELFYDFYFVSYNRTKKMFIIFLCVVAFIDGINLLVGNYDIVLTGLFISYIMLIVYFRTKKLLKINYERNLISAGKESTLQYELFEDKIVGRVDELKREYFYHQITKLFETKSFLLLHLKYNVFIMVEKSNLNADVDIVKSFLLKKCTLVKKKKFINCANDKKWSLVFLIALIAVSVIGTVVGLVLNTSSMF